MNDNLLQILRDMRKNADALPRDSFIVNARIRILNLTTHIQTPLAGSRRRSLWRPVRFAFITLGLIMMFGGSIVYAAQTSLPGSTLYPVKVASETVALGLAPTSAIKTAVAGAVIDRRAMEVTELKTYASPKVVEEAVTEYQSTVSDFRSMHGLNRDNLEEHIREHENIFGKNGGSDNGKEDGHTDRESGMPTGSGASPSLVPTLTPTPTSATSENKETSGTTSSAVLGTHSSGDKHPGDEHGGD